MLSSDLGPELLQAVEVWVGKRSKVGGSLGCRQRKSVLDPGLDLQPDAKRRKAHRENLDLGSDRD